MDAIDRFGQELVLAGRRRHAGPLPLRALFGTLRALFGTRVARTSRRRRTSAHVRLALVVIALVLATAAITLAATGVILTGSPVATVRAPIATAGEGIPVAGGARLLPRASARPGGGLPWGMRIIHTTRGLICVQIGRVYDGQLGAARRRRRVSQRRAFPPAARLTRSPTSLRTRADGWRATVRVREKSTPATASGSASARPPAPAPEPGCPPTAVRSPSGCSERTR